MSAIIENLANQIELKMGKLTDSMEVSGTSDGDELNMNVGIDTEAITQKLSGLLQEAFNQNNLSHQDSIDLATICFHRFMEISIDEARELALESISP
jgi:hypothetical protein